jgi:hypothetical protein
MMRYSKDRVSVGVRRSIKFSGRSLAACYRPVRSINVRRQSRSNRLTAAKINRVLYGTLPRVPATQTSRWSRLISVSVENPSPTKFPQPSNQPGSQFRPSSTGNPSLFSKPYG